MAVSDLFSAVHPKPEVPLSCIFMCTARARSIQPLSCAATWLVANTPKTNEIKTFFMKHSLRSTGLRRQTEIFANGQCSGTLVHAVEVQARRTACTQLVTQIRYHLQAKGFNGRYVVAITHQA